MLEYHNNILCVHGGWLYKDTDVLSESNYKQLTSRGAINQVRRACINHPALIEYESIPERFKNKIVSIIGDPYKKVKHNRFEDKLQHDPEASRFFADYKLPDGRNLPEANQQQYTADAEVLNTIHKLVGSNSAKRKALGGRVSQIWQKLPNLVHSIDKSRYPHNLPANERRLKQKYKDYLKGSYQSLVSKKFGNNNSRKVNVEIEQLLLSLYCLPNKPYANEVYEKYMQFLGGTIDVVDVKTGEIFDRANFIDEKGLPITISESTVWNYINDPKNRLLVEKHRSGALEFNSIHRPHHHRYAPNYSLSKVSLDDRDLPRKMHDGKRVKAYYAYDVTSGCIIGASYSKTKDKNLFINCLRNMFRFIKKQDLMMPMEVEVEHHLVNTYKNDLMKAGEVFPFVRWANPGNAQEKYAETMNRTKKYGYEKRYQQGIGRFYAKLEANRTHQDKVFDGENTNYKEKTFSFEELVADDMHMVHLLNNDLHPDQKKYKGMTRLDVLKYKVNPNCVDVPEYRLYKYIGNVTTTTIRRSQYVKVQYENYQLPSPQVLSRLKPNNLSVTAYYLADDDNTIQSVYLWQDGEFICECKKINEYNRSTAERTEADNKALQEQRAYVDEFTQLIKTNTKALPKLHINEVKDNYNNLEVEIVQSTQQPVDDDDDFNLDDDLIINPKNSRDNL